MEHLIGSYIDDKYRLIKAIGSGGMGVVFEAEDLQNQKKVALKILRKQVQDPKAKERFLREVQSLAKMESPYIIRVLAFGRDMKRGLLYATMELANGDDLSTLLDIGRIPVPLSVQIIEHICRSLIAIHKHDIYHRDLKPSNIKLVPHPPHIQCKILDFGLVRVEDGVELTAQGQAPGTISYMSPEELKEEPIDHRIDIYKLGVICFQMLTGRKPYQGTSPLTTAQKVIFEPIPRVSDFVQIPEALDNFVRKLMSRNPEMRYQNAELVLEALNEIVLEIKPERFCCKHTGKSVNPKEDYDLLPLENDKHS